MVHQQLNMINDIILNVFRSVFPNRFITCDGRGLHWVNDSIKKSNGKIVFTKIIREMAKRLRTISY